MPKVIPFEVKQQAEELKKQGYTNKQISEELGVSDRWCKTHLKHITPDEEKIMSTLYEKSKSKDAVSKNEISKSFDLYSLPEDEALKQLNSKVKKIRSKGSDYVVRPDWMAPSFARHITDAVVQTSLVLEDRCNEEAYFLWLELKESCTEEQLKTLPSVSKIKNAMMSLASTSTSGRKKSYVKLKNWLDSLYKTVYALENRNSEQKVISLSDIAYQSRFKPVDLSDLEDNMY